mmetsp:Transcript_40327/g.66985  ORF Transcript_40327/g.66985 Transcript_40327/m.66985 type:complete len:94 (+) Transcript_40327:215-496(+)
MLARRRTLQAAACGQSCAQVVWCVYCANHEMKKNISFRAETIASLCRLAMPYKQIAPTKMATPSSQLFGLELLVEELPPRRERAGAEGCMRQY